MSTAVDFHHYHQQVLPALLASGRGALAAAAARECGSLALRLLGTGDSYSYCSVGDAIVIEAGHERADTVIELDLESWRGLVADLESVPALLYGHRLGPGCRGDMMNFVRWEPLLRTLYVGLPLYDPQAPDLDDANGTPLRTDQSFTLGRDQPEAMREYLQRVGYLLVKNVFSNAELESFRAAALRLRDSAEKNDKASWWGVGGDGVDICTRVLDGGREPTLLALAADARIDVLHQLMPAGLKPHDATTTDGITVIFKTACMAAGLSDLPWHRDCGMGGHARMCPTINLSIYLHDATAEAGELRFLPGSHRCAYGVIDADDPRAPTGIAVAARAGDVTLHHSDVMHAAPPPRGHQGPFRTSVLMSFRPDYEHHRGDRHYNDVLLQGNDGQVTHLTDVAR